MEDSVVMSGDGIKEGTGVNSATVGGRKRSDQHMQLQGDDHEDLIPGIPNEVTINEIATKLPWKAFHTLSSVSCGWRRAIQSHQVYDARVRSKCTQTLVAFKNLVRNKTNIFLYSIEESSWYRLPMIPGVKKGFPVECQCIFLDGKVYVLGGLKDRPMFRVVTAAAASAKVYVLDMAGQREWKQCRRMKHPRTAFGCGAKDGKIYVFGGLHRFKRVRGSEVYDPKEETWSPIKPIPSLRFELKVTNLGDELFVLGGNGRNNPDVLSAALYRPDKNEWRIVKHFFRDWHDLLVLIVQGGILHKLTQDGIQVYDGRTDSWKPLQPFLSVRLKSSEGFIYNPHLFLLAAVAVKDEIFAMAILQIDHSSTYESCLIRSQGVFSENKEIVWRKLPFPSGIEKYGASHLSVIHL